MNIYLLEQDINTEYDTYDSCVVIAENEDSARNIHPSSFVTHVTDGKWMGSYSEHCADVTLRGKEYEQDESGWVEYSRINEIRVTQIGIALEGKSQGVVCASFNAG